jgi:hypothetical protein
MSIPRVTVDESVTHASLTTQQRIRNLLDKGNVTEVRLTCTCGPTGPVEVRPGDTPQTLIARLQERRTAKLPSCPHPVEDRP